MKKIFSKYCNRCGFTLVELLVVISIIGVIASVSIVAVDPLEQVNRAKDSEKKAVMRNYLNGFHRYKAVNGAYPWDPINSGGENCNGGVPPSGKLIYGEYYFQTGCTSVLGNTGELKAVPSLIQIPGNPNYYANTTLPQFGLFITEKANGSLTICFDPTSRAESRGLTTRFDSIGDATCDNSTSLACYFCVEQ